ncbi:MAG TPA: DUF389 domain-containing protein [Alphaproteobacteria bacterium]|nr:DUF389 domain-containing protein [Alphaproteobacteria bacterium]
MIEPANLREGALADGHFSLDFGVLSLASAAIATFGLLENSVAVIIGAMIVAPLTRPIGALAFAAIDGDPRGLRRAALTLALGSGIAIAFAILVTRLFALPTLGSEITSRSQPDLLDLGVALAAGAVAGFARIRPSIAGAVAGTAIAVALMPPLCVVGIGIAHLNGTLALGSLLLFLTNLFGIMLASMIVFVVAGYAHVLRARSGLLWTALALAVIVVPLALSTGQLLRQARLESELRSALLSGTVTFHRADLLGASFDWVASPPLAHLLVRSQEPISPGQVRALEAFAKAHTGTDFKLVLDVSPITRVEDEPSPSPTPSVTPSAIPSPSPASST